MTTMISIEECEQIGHSAVNRIFKIIATKLNDIHKNATELKFFDQLSIDVTKEERILQDAFPDVFIEIVTLLKEEYKGLDELEQHCLFIYLFTNNKDEDEIVDAMVWHLEEWMEERAYDFIYKANVSTSILN